MLTIFLLGLFFIEEPKVVPVHKQELVYSGKSLDKLRTHLGEYKWQSKDIEKALGDETECFVVKFILTEKNINSMEIYASKKGTWPPECKLIVKLPRDNPDTLEIINVILFEIITHKKNIDK